MHVNVYFSRGQKWHFGHVHLLLSGLEGKVMDWYVWTCESTSGVKSVRELLLVIRCFLTNCVNVACLVSWQAVVPGKFRKGSNLVACFNTNLCTCLCYLYLYYTLWITNQLFQLVTIYCQTIHPDGSVIIRHKAHSHWQALMYNLQYQWLGTDCHVGMYWKYNIKVWESSIYCILLQFIVYSIIYIYQLI